MNSSRFPLLDAIRGIAIVLMIFFHLFFDLTVFGLTDIDFITEPFWYWLPRLIVFLFFSCVGISLVIVHGEKIKWMKWLKHIYPIILGALGVTVATYYVFPENYVLFGTLHCIAASCLLSPLFLRFPKISLGLSLLTFIFYNFVSPWEFPNTTGIVEKSVDIIPLYPWGAIVLWGIFWGHFKGGAWFRLDHKLNIILRKKVFSPLLFLGKHSLAVYLVHQPLLFSLAWLIAKLKAW